VTAVDDSPGVVADRLMSGVGSDYRLCVEFWRDRAHTAEQERDELGRQLRDARDMLAERNGLLRRVCIEKAYTIRDADTLDSLPVGSIIRDAEGDAVQCDKRPGAWFYPAERYQFSSDDIPLPALLLWNPLWEADE